MPISVPQNYEAEASGTILLDMLAMGAEGWAEALGIEACHELKIDKRMIVIPHAKS